MAIEQQDTGTQIDQPVVTMTARATDKLKEVIAKQGRADLALRVYVTPGGCSGFSYGMTFAEGREQDDTLVETDGVRIVVDPMSAMYLKGSEIDFVDALMGGGFALRNPNLTVGIHLAVAQFPAGVGRPHLAGCCRAVE